MHLGEGSLHGEKRVTQANAGVGEPTRVDDQPREIAHMESVDQLTLVIRLHRINKVQAGSGSRRCDRGLNLGHTLGHALEQAAGYQNLLHGEAVGYGLRAALQIGVELGVTPAPLAARGIALLDALGLGVAPRTEPVAALLAAAGRDKKVAEAKIRWVLASDDGYVIRNDVPASLVERAAAAMLAGVK